MTLSTQRRPKLRSLFAEVWHFIRGLTLPEVIVAIIILLILTAIVTPIWIGVTSRSKQDASGVYTDSFTSSGRCLHDSPYDPERGAQLVYARFSNTDVLVVIPQGANSYRPAILMFGISPAPLSDPELTPADHQTAAFMESVCHVFGSGT